MAKTIPFRKSADMLARLMHKDTVDIYESRPTPDDIGEVGDGNFRFIGRFSANVTTPGETVDEETQGNTRTHYYDIAISPQDAEKLPLNSKIFIHLIDVRQGEQDAVVEMIGIQGGLLGSIISAADEKN